MKALLRKAMDKMPMMKSGSAYDFAMEHFRFPESGTILDFGTGNGHGVAYLSRNLPNARIISLDWNMECVHWSELEFGPSVPAFVQADVTEVPIASESVDMVEMVMTFHCLPKPERVMSESFRVLKPGGSIFIADVDGRHWMAKPFEWIEHWLISPLTHAYTEEEFGKLLGAAGFESIRVYRRENSGMKFMMWIFAEKPVVRSEEQPSQNPEQKHCN